MTLSDISIKNPVFAVMLSAAMVVFGYLGYRDMGDQPVPGDRFPRRQHHHLSRSGPAGDHGLRRHRHRRGRGRPASRASITSRRRASRASASSPCSFTCIATSTRPCRTCRTPSAAAVHRLPTDIDPPIVSKVNFNKFPVMWLAVHGNRPLPEISRFVDDHLKQHVQTIPGVGGVMYGGLRSRNMPLWLDEQQAAGVQPRRRSTSCRRLRIEHVERPAGYLQSDWRELNVRTMGEARTAEEFEQIPVVIAAARSSASSDVAVVEDGLEDRRSFARFNRQPTVGVGVMRAIGANVVEVCDEVKEQLPELRKMLPPGMEIGISTDYSLFIIDDIEEVKLALLLGIMLTAVVTFLFLGSIGTTLNVCMSIPTSLIGTFLAIKWFGSRSIS